MMAPEVPGEAGRPESVEWTPMEPQVYPFRGGRVSAELFLFAALAAAFVLIVVGFFPGLVESDHILPLVLAVQVLGALLLGFFRWRSRIRLDGTGIEWRRSRDKVRTRLEWEEVEELFLVGRDGYEVRGAGKAIRVSSAYHVPWNARDFCSARLFGLRDRLRARALREGELVFRMPTGRLRAHGVYLLSILFLTGITALGVIPLFRKGRFGFPVFFIFFGGSWLWSLRRRASRLGTIVTLYRDGLLLRRLDGRNRIAWSDVEETEWDGKGGLIVRMKSGKTQPLPPGLGNLTILEEFIEEARSAAGSRA
jgi:hypothetical protein